MPKVLRCFAQSAKQHWDSRRPQSASPPCPKWRVVSRQSRETATGTKGPANHVLHSAPQSEDVVVAGSEGQPSRTLRRTKEPPPHVVRSGGSFMSEDVREGQPSDPAVGDLGLVVHRLELQQVLIAVHGGLLVLLEELLGALGEGTRQRSVTGLVHQELLITARGLLGIE